ncbi:hypothetical protein I204_05253 [Kwoniella mangroviensis CBS 8886]|uniref:uncharacterized protein n=1 Tax=Kwoniella mangroviensis CBS 8507 TaxID=1296122 RepID=UPI00080CF161|nr:uncharacterized protein I203_04606 [Kwoniella mangroviensis CBS 8507]OCF66278.1 hypothetical protein I203_04606 [Kwoniella mangroviensis CBS 8507]OCF73415.1 hypothetical protein I204_05253 [Kwoniella mangroviensis CBS 8886]
MAKASSSSQPPKVKSSKKQKKDKAPQAISPEEVPSDVDSDNIDQDINVDNGNDDDNGSSSSSSDSESEVDSEENLENITPNKKSSKVANTAAEKRGKSLRKYEPPIGMTELKVSSAFTSSPFEWDNLANKPGVELWAIRVPKDLKPSRLSSLQLALPSNTSGPITGSLKTKSHSYTLSTAGTNIHTKTKVDEQGRQPTSGPGAIDSMRMDVDESTPREMKVEGGEEMDGLRLLVPKVKEGGKLFVASKPITRKLIITPSIDQPSTSTSSANEPALPSFLSNPTTDQAVTQEPANTRTKRSQPTHLLKFRNQAYGFTTPGPEHTVVKSMDVDGQGQDDTAMEPSSQVDTVDKVKDKKEKKEKEKKRKNETGDSPKKKSKKSKD